LIERGIPAKNIIVFERYANEFCDAGYKSLVERELPGVRWLVRRSRAIPTSNSTFAVAIRDCAELSSDVSRKMQWATIPMFSLPWAFACHHIRHATIAASARICL
jgi:hypothetical protein